MASPARASTSEVNQEPPKYYIFKETTSETPQGYDIYKVLVDSDEGRNYAKLTTDPERLQFVRQYAHEKMSIVFPTWHYYEDPESGKEYSILIDSPEGREVDELMGDSDDELGEEASRKLLAYFKAHAHKVQDFEPVPCEIGGNK